MSVKHVVGQLSEFPPGSQRQIVVDERKIAVFNIRGRLYAVKDACPHKGAPLSCGVPVGALTATKPGDYKFDGESVQLRCPWHGWEYDLETGQSWYNPKGGRVPAFPISVEPGQQLVKGPYVAETIDIAVEDDYVIVELKN